MAALFHRQTWRRTRHHEIKERVWSEREEEILHRYGHLPISSVQKRLALSGFERSCAAVQVKVTRLKIKQNLDGYSVCSLAVAFGVDVHKVLRWLPGRLAAGRRGGGGSVGAGGAPLGGYSSGRPGFRAGARRGFPGAGGEVLGFRPFQAGGNICRWWFGSGNRCGGCPEFPYPPGRGARCR